MEGMNNLLLCDGNLDIVKTIISFMTMTETIGFLNLNKQKIRKSYSKFIVKQ
jgi:hypothetical protein